MSDYTDLLQAIENDYEAQLLNEYFNQEKIHWEPVSNKKKKLEEIREKYYQTRKMIKQKIKGKVND